jgi:predicted MPP superfamily phosphohydrolase
MGDMLHDLAEWLIARTKSEKRKGRLARWVGRSWAKVHYGLRVEPTWLEVSNCSVPIADLPASFEGFRIAHLSDFHCSRHVTPAYIRKAADLTQEQAADLVVLTGDFIHKGFRYIDILARTLARLSAPHGVYAVLGNHDYSVRNALGIRRHRRLPGAVADALRSAGIRVLHNESVPLTRDGAAISLVGVEDLWSRECDLERAYHGLSPDVPCVTMAHNPRTVERLSGRRCDLMLSGHTHGGQVRFERSRKRPSKRRFIAGLYVHERTHLYVNKGVGHGTFRFRYGVRPEVAIITLTKST